MLGLTFSSKLDWGSSIISIAKTASIKIGALIHSMKFLSPEVALYLHKSTIHPCMEYCCHLWAVAPSCYLELLGKLQKWIYRTVGPSLAASLEPFAHCRNVASLRAIVCKIQANGESDHLRIVFFFIYVRDFHERKLKKKFYSKNFVPHSFYGHVKLPLPTIRFRNMF